MHRAGTRPLIRVTRLASLRAHVGRSSRGQSAVEFAFTFPIFILLVVGMIEFSLAFNALLSINFASRDAALLAAEAASDTGADCVILNSIESDVNAPTNAARIQQVRIYWSDVNGVERSNAANVYTRTGSKTCNYPNGTSLTVPYTATSTNYPEADRCDVVDGCPGTPAHATLDTIGVAITYDHSWITPIANLVSLGGTGFEFTHSNAMRMEPSR
jgi:Flp pilus assembly protein TadG